MNINIEIIEVLEKEISKSMELNEIPVGAVIIDSNQNIIASAHNDRQSTSNVLGHAEINAIISAEKRINDWRLDGYSMIVSLEPCQMCESVIKESRLDHVYFFLKSNYSNSSNNKFVEIDGFDDLKKNFDN